MSMRNDDDLRPDDIQLAQQLARTLESSSAALDAATVARLAALRVEALQSVARRRRAAAGLALAAGLAAAIAVPFWWHRQSEPAPVDLAYLSTDPEMLADMDMLLAVGEDQ